MQNYEYLLKDIMSPDYYQYLDLKEIPKGEHLLLQGQQLTQVYILLKGKVRTTHITSNGSTHLYSISSPLTLIGEIEFMSRQDVQNDVFAMTDCECYVIDVIRYRDVFMKDQAGTTLHIYIPASRDLLFQYDKKEHEERFIRDITESTVYYKQNVPELIDPTLTSNGLIATGGECYMIDSLRNDVFWTKNNKILWDAKSFPEESMRNILMGAAETGRLAGMFLDVTPHTYNKEIKKFKIQLNLFLGYIQQQGFRLYTGNMGRNGDKCQCLLAMYHPVYNYLHLLSVSFTPAQLESAGETVIKADLSTFIPQHNIKNLFQEK